MWENMIRGRLFMWETIWSEKRRYKGIEKEHEEIRQGIMKCEDNIIGTVWRYLPHSPGFDHCS